jgi:succinoglycan biosynthesis transport protein ExoP
VTMPVIRDVGLHMRPDALARRLSVDVPLNSVLLNISASDTRPAMAARIVNSVTRSLANAVTEIEGSQQGRPSAVQIHVVRAGSVPSVPSSPRPVLNICLGLVLGAIAGVGAGLLKDALDTRIRRSTDLAQVGEMPLLGEIPYENFARKQPLANERDPFSPRSEAFRRLRTNLRFISVDKPPRTIVISSPLKGDGKSSAALNLAFSLADDGARVVLIDADLRRPSIASSLGLVEEAGLTSVLSGQAEVAEVIQRAERQSAIDVMASGPVPPNPSELLGTRKMRVILQELRANADYVIVDSPPLLALTDAAVVASSADGVLLVVRTGRTKRDHLHDALESLRAVNANTLGVVMNMTKEGNRERYRYYYRRGTRPGKDAANVPIPSPEREPLRPEELGPPPQMPVT